VGFRAGEVHQRGSVAGVRDDAEVDLESVAQHDGRSAGAARKDLSDILVGGETRADGGGVIRGREQVEVAYGVLPSSKAARCGDPAAADGRLQEGDQRVDLLFDARELVARLGRRLRESCSQRLFDASAKAFQAVKTPPFHRSPQIVEGSHSELVVQLAHPFWAHPRQRRDRRKLPRDFALEVVKRSNGYAAEAGVSRGFLSVLAQ